MGSLKEYWMEIQEQEKDDWIREQLNEEFDECSDEWFKLSEEFDFQKEFYAEEHELIQEYAWHKRHSYSEFHAVFSLEIENLRQLLYSEVDAIHEYAYCKMIYAHAVTVLEAFLGESIKSLVISNDIYLANAITNISELKIIKPSLEEIMKQENIVHSLVLKWLSGTLFHNIPKVMRIYASVLEKKIDIDINDICIVTTIRHDIVHRNGKTADGELINIDKKKVEESILTIENFVSSLCAFIERK